MVGTKTLSVNYLDQQFKIDASFRDGLIDQLADPFTNWEREELLTL